MVKRSNTVTRIPTVRRRPELAADIQTPRGGFGGARTGAVAAGVLADLSANIEASLDRAAQKEGARAGGVAGLDPDFRPRGDGTIRSDAFDRAATRTFLSRLEIEVRTAAQQAFADHKDNPKALGDAFDELKTGFLGGLRGFDEILPDVELIIEGERLAAQGQALRLQEARNEDTARGAFLDQLDTKSDAMERLAFGVGDDGEAAALLGQELEALQTLLLENGPRGAFEFGGEEFAADPGRSGVLDVADIEKIFQANLDRAAGARVLGKFRAIGTASGRQAFVDEFKADFTDPDSGDFADNRTAGLDFAQFERLSGAMAADINRDRVASNGARAALKREAGEAVKLLEEGFSVPGRQLDNLARRAGELGDADVLQDIADAHEISGLHIGLRAETPRVVQSVINAMRGRIADAGNQASPLQVRKLRAAERLLATMNTELARDPLSFAARVGVAQVPPIQLEGEPAAIIESMKARLAVAKGVSDKYRIPPRLLTAEEEAEFKQFIEASDVDGRLTLIGRLQEGFGDEVFRVLERIAPDAPLFTHAAGLSVIGKAQKVTAKDILTGQAALAQGNAVLPSRPELDDVVQKVMGGALSDAARTADTRANLIAAAEAIYAVGIIRRGKGATKALDKDLFKQSLHRAAGASFNADGDRVGGFGVWNGGFIDDAEHKIVLPPGIDEDTFDDVMDKLTDADLERASVGGGAPRDKDGRPFTADDLRSDGRLIDFAEGQYLIDTSEDGSELVKGTERTDGLYVLDLTLLLPELLARQDNDIPIFIGAGVP